MNKQMRFALGALALAAAAICTPARAQQPQIFWGEDASCAAWSKTANNKAMRAYYEFWVRGFVSGHNFASPRRQVVIGDLPGGEELYDYIDRYCAQNPKSPFVGAAIGLTEQLRTAVPAPKAKAAAPKPAAAAPAPAK